MLKKNRFQLSQCVVLKQNGLYVESKLKDVELKLFLQFFICGFNICLFLVDQTARINPTEVSTFCSSFGGFKTTRFQLDRASRTDSTRISYCSCHASSPEGTPRNTLCMLSQCFASSIERDLMRSAGSWPRLLISWLEC
jgi:hypothetical protein